MAITIPPSPTPQIKNKHKTQNTRDIKKQFAVFESAAHPVLSLLDKHSLETQNGVATSESCMGAETCYLKCKAVTVQNLFFFLIVLFYLTVSRGFYL
jgi:hypothetical protein